jgi:hypothetical protein
MAIYDGFDNWAAVAGDFTGYYDWDEERKAKSLKEIPEPEEVILAAYHQESYEGDAWVIYRNGDKYYTVDGGHCSCYGLEGQWKPEEYPDAKTLFEALDKGDWSYSYGAKKEHYNAVKDLLQQRSRESDDNT